MTNIHIPGGQGLRILSWILSGLEILAEVRNSSIFWQPIGGACSQEFYFEISESVAMGGFYY